MESINRISYRGDIDGLRAVAVTGVVLYHLNKTFVSGGFVGVDIFFVISGYLIAAIVLADMRAGRFSAADFYFRRARRIVPALGAVLLATWALGYAFLLPQDFAALGVQLASGATFVANIAFWLEAGYFSSPAVPRTLLHLWSLGVEEQFYLFFPLVAIAAWRIGCGAILAFGVLLAISLAACVISTPLAGDAAFYLAPFRLWELLTGALLAAVQARGNDPIAEGALPRHVASWLGLSMIVASFVAFDGSLPFPGWVAILPVAGAALVVWAGPMAHANRLLLDRAAMRAIGRISYPLYLWHFPLLAFAREAQRIWPDLRFAGAAAVLASFVLAAATYLWIELPVRRMRPGPSRLPAAMLLGTLAAFAALGVATHASVGFVSRFPDEARHWATFDFDAKRAYRNSQCFGEPKSMSPADTALCWGDAQDGRPRVVLWGDSHAAHLYPGIAPLAEKRGFALAQFTLGGCPPVLDLGGAAVEACRIANIAAMRRIAELRPATVVLAANWDGYRGSSIIGAPLADTVGALRSAGVASIVVVGPVPDWPGTLPRILTRAAIDGRGAALDPIRTEGYSISATEKGMRGIVDAIYVSAIDVFCDSRGCASFDPATREPYVWDSNHLTGAGARRLAEAIAPMLPAR
jgi:peptidoglycan/LPS O-acetylase OafA/YrhL